MRVVRFAAVVTLIGLVLSSLTSQAVAQVTTSTVRGTVRSADDGAPMAEVEVTLVDESTGSVKTTTTNTSGDFAFTNLQVGGPYHITAQVGGFKPAEEKEIFLSANKSREVALALRLQEEVIEVAGASIARSTSSRTVVTAAEIDSLPSVGRDPRDVVRRNPEVSVEGRDRALSIGGANNRFNSVTVDGIRQDDDFGLNSSGYPTRRSPISLSAIQELAVDASPFDVHYSKFLGGNVNIITKSGTNEFQGTLVGSYSGDSFLGSRTRDNHVKADYNEYRYGATVGGPIIKDKLHFLLSVEGLNATTPVSVGTADSNAATKATKVSQTALDEIQQISKEVYGFDAGDPARATKEGDLKLLGKVDWTINKDHRATVMYQRTGGNSIQQTLPRADGSTLPLTSNWYDARDTLNTFSGRVFSDWAENLSTQVEVDAKLVSSRTPPLNGNGFMQATINTQELSSDMSTGGQIILGAESNRHANELDNNLLHGKAEASYLVGDNLLTAGMEYEQVRIRNLFVPSSFGVAQYASIDDFRNKRPSSLFYQNAVTLNPEDAQAKWNVGTWSGYAQDQLRVSSDLTVQLGARFEAYQTFNHVTRNQNFVNRYADTLDIDNTETLNGRTVILPRVGVSYLPTDRLNLRAGLGLYSGGTPSVWASNNYSNDGVRISQTNVQCNAANPANCALLEGFDGRSIPQGVKDRVIAGNGDVDLLDPNFKIPSSWKIGTGADYAFDIPGLDELGKNVELRLNYTFTKVRNGVNWVDLRRDLAGLSNAPNNRPIGETPDGRALYADSYNVTRGSDMMLTNTDHGHGHVASIQAQKGFPFGLFLAGSYAYQNVYEINPGTSSRSVSNYGQSAVVDPNNPANGISNYERPHRLTGTVEYSYPIASYITNAAPWKTMKTSLGLFVESRSGQPFSWTFGATENGRDANGTKLAKIFGETTTFSIRNRELFYVPTEAETCVGALGAPASSLPDGCKVILSTGANAITPEQFNTFLKRTGLDKYRGQIVPRNAFSSPWYTRLDVRLAQDLPNPLSGQRARLVVDIENAGNLINRKWGRLQAAPFPYTSPAVDLDYDRMNNKYVYSNLKSTNPTTVDLLQSVWRISVGLMYDF